MGRRFIATSKLERWGYPLLAKFIDGTTISGLRDEVFGLMDVVEEGTMEFTTNDGNIIRIGFGTPIRWKADVNQTEKLVHWISRYKWSDIKDALATGEMVVDRGEAEQEAMVSWVHRHPYEKDSHMHEVPFQEAVDQKIHHNH